MSEYKYTDKDGDTLEFGTAALGGFVFVAAFEGAKMSRLLIANEDAPTVAAELLKAAGQEGVFVAAPAIGEVTEDGDQLKVNGEGYVRMDREFWEGCNQRETASLERFASTNAITRAILAFYDDKDGREAAAKSQLAERRNRIAAELAMGGHGTGAFIPGAYASARESMQRAIDRIIELEDKQAA